MFDIHISSDRQSLQALLSQLREHADDFETFVERELGGLESVYERLCAFETALRERSEFASAGQDQLQAQAHLKQQYEQQRTELEHALDEARRNQLAQQSELEKQQTDAERWAAKCQDLEQELTSLKESVSSIEQQAAAQEDLQEELMLLREALQLQSEMLTQRSLDLTEQESDEDPFELDPVLDGVIAQFAKFNPPDQHRASA